MIRRAISILAAAALMLALPASTLAAGPAVAGSAPRMSMSLAPGIIFTGNNATLTMSLSNPDAVDMSGVAFTATLPSGLAAASSSKSACGGTLSVSGPTVALTGGQLAANGSCSTSISVTGTASGSYAVSARPSRGGTAGASVRATIRVIAAPVASATLYPAQVTEYGQSYVSIAIDNPNSMAIPGISFTLSAPEGQQVGAWEGLPCGAAVSPVSGLAKTATFTGGTLPANGTCHFNMLVTTHPEGHYTFSTGSIRFQYGSIPGVSATLAVALPAPRTPGPAPTPTPTHASTAASTGASSAVPGASQSPVRAATSTGGDSGLPIVALGLLAVLGLVCVLALVWRGRRTPAADALYRMLREKRPGAIPSLAVVALVLGAVALVLAAFSIIDVTGGSNAVSASPSNIGAAGASASPSEADGPVAVMKMAPDPGGKPEQALLTIAIENPTNVDILDVSFTLTGPDDLRVDPGDASPQCGGQTVMRAPTYSEVTVAGGIVPAHSTCSFTIRVTAVVVVNPAARHLFSTSSIRTPHGYLPGVDAAFEVPVRKATPTPTAASAAVTGGDSGSPTVALAGGGLGLLALGGVLTLVWRRRRAPAEPVEPRGFRIDHDGQRGGHGDAQPEPNGRGPVR